MGENGDGVISGVEYLMGVLKKGTAKNMADCIFGWESRPIVPHLYALSVSRLWEEKKNVGPVSFESLSLTCGQSSITFWLANGTEKAFCLKYANKKTVR